MKKINNENDPIYSLYVKNNSWGILTSIDLQGCDPKTIRSAKKIREFVVKLCLLIKVKRFGKCIIVHFGRRKEIEGYSMVQLIETSLISGHFAEASNGVYLDIFSCQYYNPEQVLQFSKKFFKAKTHNHRHILRK